MYTKMALIHSVAVKSVTILYWGLNIDTAMHDKSTIQTFCMLQSRFCGSRFETKPCSHDFGVQILPNWEVSQCRN